MALTEDGGMNTTMLMQPANSGVFPAFMGNNNGFGGDGWWIILLIIILAIGGNGFGNNGNNTVPYMINTDNAVQTGFNQAALTSSLGDISTSLCNGFSNVQQSLCNGFAGVNATVNNGFSQAEIANNSRQMANMNQMFGLQSQLANCCCENRLATANLGSLVQSENCADRQALSDGVRDIITNQTANTQKILDTLCQNQIEQKNDTIAQLRSELMFARGQASQDVQTAQILTDNLAQTNAIEQYLAPVPRPAYIVQNPNCCATNSCGVNCGCGIA